MSEKLTVIVPDEEKFKPAPIPFACVSGKGVPDYDHVKSKGKRGGMQYTASVLLTKKEAEQFKKKVLEFWDDNKPKKAGDEPANFKNIVRKAKEPEDDRKFIVYAKSKTEFDGQPNEIAIVDGEGMPLDPEEYGTMGKGSKGRIAATLSIYGDDEDAGVSVFIGAIKVTEFKKHKGGSAASAFSKKEEGSVKGGGGFSKKETDEEPKKKKKKKKK